MKILAVRFQNLNSLKGEHEIRFDQSPLAESGLFAITGPTGAGKTTILDAITVGLYGLVHRHNNHKPLELMTRHTAESFSEVEFEADGKQYRSKWHIRRSHGKADGKIQPIHMELFSFEDETLFDLKPSQVPDKVAELCGLDYSQFLRSVMLSQGDFARFLKADQGERSSLLEKITDTGIYSDISKFAFEKTKVERQKQEDLERKLQDIALLPEEQRQAYETSIKELSAQEASYQESLKTLQEQVQWLQQLTQLAERKQHHYTNLQTQEQKLEQLQPEFQKLTKHEQANQFVGELAEIRSADSKLTEVQEQLDTLQKKLPVLETELELTGKLATDASIAKDKQEEALLKLEPLLDQVSRLDHQLATIRDTYQNDKNTYVQFEAQLNEDKTALQTKQQELSKLTTEATSIKNWLAENEKLQDLREHLPEFRQTLKELQELEVRIKRLLFEKQELKAQQLADAQQAKELQQAQDQQKILHEQLNNQKQEKMAELKAILANKSFDELEQATLAQPAIVAKYERLSELSQQHARLQLKLQSIVQQLALKEEAKTTKSTQLATAQQKYKETTEHLDALQKIVDLQKQIQQYEEARHTLTEGEPCPLCGSEQHPFVEHGYHFDLPEEVLKRDKQQKLVKEIEQSITASQLELATLQQQLQQATIDHTEAEKESNRLSQTFEQVAEGISESIAITEVNTLANLLQVNKASQTALQSQTAQARVISRDVESINQQLQQNREAQMQSEAKYNQLQANEKLTQNQLLKLQTVLTDQQEQFQAHTEMAESFAVTYGLMYKAEARQQLLQTLEQQSAAYALKQQALDGMREKYIEVKEQEKNLDTRVTEKNQELQKRKDTLKANHDKLTALKEERATLFGEKDPQQERQHAQQELRRLTALASDMRAAHLEKQQELKQTQALQTECFTKHQQNKSVLDKLRDGLLHVLQQKGIETIETLSQMLLDRDEATRLDNLKKHTEKQLTELRQSLTDVQQELEQTKARQLTQESIEILRGQLQEKTSQLSDIIAERARQQQRLEQDTAQREKNKELADQIKIQQHEHHRWAQLSDLIGSADGTKFSRFAQGLTLARLVELANRHLQKLNDRYRILKSPADDLELLIVDTYQAEAIRPMNTLSGGESFLVSLALALGLSDLAGRRTQINSLFIDEGFGTLDAETLDAAISTLENLQAGGKMIGIISHVEALKERISTQIKVQRQAGGVSKVEVVSY